MNAWLALLDQASGDQSARTSTGQWLCTWRAATAPHPSALMVDPDLLGAGPACHVALVLIAPHLRPIADDPEVIECRRNILRDVRIAGSSLLTDDPVHVAGAIVCADSRRPEQILALRDNPYQRLGRASLMEVGAGVLAPTPAKLGPVTERYAGVPWPHQRW